MPYLTNNSSFSTDAIHIGSEAEKWNTSDLMPHICLATTYEQVTPPDHKGLMYSRLENPTRTCLEECLAKLEETKYCLTFPSGMAAASTVKSLLRKGDHVIAQTDLYHGVFNMFKDLDSRTDEIEVTFCDASSTENFAKCLKRNTSLVWLESPTNPLMKLVNIKEIAELVKSNNSSTILVIDNTFMSPYFQRPATFGVDIVMHSCTKYIGGHSDVLMGALCTNKEKLYEQLKQNQILLGPIPSPFDCYLVIRSLKTLEIRMQRHMTNALKLAQFLDNHPLVEKVFHPGLPSHPQHELAMKQCYGHSGMFSLYIQGHKLEITRKFLQKLKLIMVADSLGGTETTVKLPSHMPPKSLTEKEMESQGITEGLLRVSVGLENPDDLIEDFRQALDISI